MCCNDNNIFMTPAIPEAVAVCPMFVFIDPFLSVMTDDVVLGKCKESLFRQYIVYMVIARIAGTLLAQIIFVPSARIIAYLAGIL